MDAMIVHGTLMLVEKGVGIYSVTWQSGFYALHVSLGIDWTTGKHV